jgi:hypothetical protein
MWKTKNGLRRETHMELEKYLNNNTELPKIKRFATLSKKFDDKLNFLIKIIEPEE